MMRYLWMEAEHITRGVDPVTFRVLLVSSVEWCIKTWTRCCRSIQECWCFLCTCYQGFGKGPRLMHTAISISATVYSHRHTSHNVSFSMPTSTGIILINIQGARQQFLAWLWRICHIELKFSIVLIPCQCSYHVSILNLKPYFSPVDLKTTLVMEHTNWNFRWLMPIHFEMEHSVVFTCQYNSRHFWGKRRRKICSY